MDGNGKCIIGVGLACLDQLVIWQDTAVAVQDNSIVNSDLQGGGMAATAMVAVSRLGGQAELWAAIGDDWVGEQIISELVREGVDIEQMTRTTGARSLFIVVCIDRKTGERYFKPTSEWDRPDCLIGDLSRLVGAGCLLIDHALPDSELLAAKEAQRLGVPVVSDTERRGWQMDVMQYVDYAICSEEAANTLHDDLEEACHAIVDMGAGCAIVTLGDKGLVFLNGDNYGQLPAFKVDVVDTTGAGDVFHGAFCTGLVNGLALESNLAFASATSAIKCGHIGGRAGIPTWDQVVEFLYQRGNRLKQKPKNAGNYR